MPEEEKKIFLWVGALVKNPAGEFLFLRRAKTSSWEPGKWQLPGGKMEWGETPMDTLKRELIEETGNDIADKPSIIGIHTEALHAKGQYLHSVQIIYNTTAANGTVKISKDHDDFAWASLQDAMKMKLAGELGKFIESQIE